MRYQEPHETFSSSVLGQHQLLHLPVVLVALPRCLSWEARVDIEAHSSEISVDLQPLGPTILPGFWGDPSTAPKPMLLGWEEGKVSSLPKPGVAAAV